MFLLNTTPHFRVVVDGKIAHVHMVCPPLKEPYRPEIK
jgi:hypothetical protein